jgi:hypothetical protein
MSEHTEQHDPPAAMQPVRDDKGQFAAGNPSDYGRPFKPGVSGNPTGRPSGVTYPGDWIRGLSGSTEADLRQIVDDKDEPVSRRAAARMLLDMLDPTPEVRGRAAIRVMDRTEGKPGVTVSVDSTSSVPRSADIKVEIAKMLRQNPELLALVKEVEMANQLDLPSPL